MSRSSHILKNVGGSGSLVYLITKFLELSESCSDRGGSSVPRDNSRGRCLHLEKNIYESLYFQSILIGITHLLPFPLLHPPVKTGCQTLQTGSPETKTSFKKKMQGSRDAPRRLCNKRQLRLEYPVVSPSFQFR